MDRQDNIKVNGSYISAFLSAYRKFLQIRDLPDKKKRLINYDLEFTQDRSNYYILFTPKYIPEDQFRVGGETALGRQTRYTVRKIDFKVIDERFFR